MTQTATSEERLALIRTDSQLVVAGRNPTLDNAIRQVHEGATRIHPDGGRQIRAVQIRTTDNHEITSAALSTIGPPVTIVLHNDLLRNHTQAEIAAVIAHEYGHLIYGRVRTDELQRGLFDNIDSITARSRAGEFRADLFAWQVTGGAALRSFLEDAPEPRREHRFNTHPSNERRIDMIDRLNASASRFRYVDIETLDFDAYGGIYTENGRAISRSTIRD